MNLERKTIDKDEEYLRQISKPVDFKNNEWKKAIEELDSFLAQKNYFAVVFFEYFFLVLKDRKTRRYFPSFTAECFFVKLCYFVCN